MPLPSLDKMVPHFSITIPSTKEEVTFRPFLVKEEKLLLIALEAGDEKSMLDAILQVVQSCALQPLKIDNLANFDLEYIFLQLRARSINDIIELAYKCHNNVPASPEEFVKRFRCQPQEKDFVDGVLKASCDTLVKVEINVHEVQVKFPEDHTKQIFLTETLGVNMRYLNYKMVKFLDDPAAEASVTDTFRRIAMCVESVFDANSVYTNFTPKEIQDWIETLTQPQFLKLQHFFNTIPKLAHDFPFLCPKCGYQETIHIEGLPSFFA